MSASVLPSLISNDLVEKSLTIVQKHHIVIIPCIIGKDEYEQDFIKWVLMHLYIVHYTQIESKITLDIWMRNRRTKTGNPGRSCCKIALQYTDFSKSCNWVFKKWIKFLNSAQLGFSTQQWLKEWINKYI